MIKELESTADQKEEVYNILLSNVAHRMYGFNKYLLHSNIGLHLNVFVVSDI